jgi:hypothetical protein
MVGEKNLRAITSYTTTITKGTTSQDTLNPDHLLTFSIFLISQEAIKFILSTGHLHNLLPLTGRY